MDRRQAPTWGVLRRQGRRIDRITLASRALARLAQRGRVGAQLAWRLDLVRAARGTEGFRDLLPERTDRIAEGTWDAFFRRMWQEAADALGAEVTDLTAGFLALRRGRAKTIVWRSQVMLDDLVTLRMALDKALSYRLLEDAGLPIPDHVEFVADDARPALAFLADSDGPCVVKPASGICGGEGVTCGVVSPDDLVRACVRSSRSSRRLLIERQVSAGEYRLLFLDGELLDAIRRRPPAVIGDGRRTVKALLGAENGRRQASQGSGGLSSIDVDLDCLFTLRASGLTLTAVPAAGSHVKVKSALSANGPSENETVHEIGSELIQEAALAAQAMGVRLAGVDVITPDPLLPLREAGGVVAGVNGTPALEYHYLVDVPERATHVAIPILSKLLRSRQPTKDPGLGTDLAIDEHTAAARPECKQ